MRARLAAVGVFAFLIAICVRPPALQADSLLPADAIPGDFSATTLFGTEYVFRGISQTDDGEPTIQGSLDYGVGVLDGVDFYVGVWGSNVDFGTDGHIEIDYYGGFAGEVPGVPGLGWDIGGIGYTFPSSPDSNFDFAEGFIGLSYDFGIASASAYAWLTPEFSGETGDAQYFNVDAEVPLPIGDVALVLHGAHQSFDENEAFGLPDYWDWKIALAVPLLGFDLEFAYIDTDIDESECFGGAKVCEERFVFLGSRSF